jgi:hypothetical protein
VKVFALELEYEDATGEPHFELRGIFKTYDDAYWHYEWHVSDADKANYIGYNITKWELKI